MIPIEYRLDNIAECEYIQKVLSCIPDDDQEVFSDKFKNILEEMKSAWDWTWKLMGEKILKDAEKFRSKYSKTYFLAKLLVMSYEEIVLVKKYLDEKIQESLGKINEEIERNYPSIKKIKSFHDLKERRKRKKIYHKNKTVVDLLEAEVEYDKIYNDFENFSAFYQRFSVKGINRWIVEKTEMRVCPYCNILYTYNRQDSATAQLDHFFPKSEYPLFALCFYNLIPSCPACNNIKRDKIGNMTSPYKENAFKNLKITWNYKNVEKENEDKKYSLKALEDLIEIEIVGSDESEEQNLSGMKIKEAYQEHRDYASEIINKIEIYCNPDAQKLICNICSSKGITPDEVERFYFGNYLEEIDLKKRPLSKLTMDFYQAYKNEIK